MSRGGCIGRIIGSLLFFVWGRAIAYLYWNVYPMIENLNISEGSINLFFAAYLHSTASIAIGTVLAIIGYLISDDVTIKKLILGCICPPPLVYSLIFSINFGFSFMIRTLSISCIQLGLIYMLYLILYEDGGSR